MIIVWETKGKTGELVDFEWREQLAPNNWSQTFFFCLFFFLVRDVGSALADIPTSGYMWIYERTCERPTLRLGTSLMISFSFGSFLFAGNTEMA